MPKNTYSSLTSNVTLSNGVVPQDYLTPIKVIDGKMAAVGDERYSVISKGTIADRPPARPPTEKRMDSSSNKNDNNNLLWIMLFVSCVALTVAVIAMVLAGIALAKASESSTTPAPAPDRGPSYEVKATTIAPQANTSAPPTVPNELKDLLSRVDQLNETMSMLYNNITAQINHQIIQSVNEAEMTNNMSLTRIYDEIQPLMAVGGEKVGSVVCGL